MPSPMLLLRLLTLFSFFLVGVLGNAQTTVLTHLSLIDGTGAQARENVSLVIQGDHITVIQPGTPEHIGPNAHVLDMTGKTVIPGLINAHGHLALISGTQNSASAYTRENVLAELRQYERYGVTTMLSLGLNRDLLYTIRAEQREGKLDGATVFTADRGIGVPGGAPPIPHAPDQLYQPSTAEEARADVRELAGRHADFVKIWVDDLYDTHPKMKPEVIRAVIDEAHQHHIPVAAHVFALDDAKFLVRAGVNVLAHSVRNRTVDSEFIQEMKQRGVYYLPTFTVDESFFVFADHPELWKDPFLKQAVSPEVLTMLSSDAYREKVASDPLTSQHRRDFATAQENLRLLAKAGVKIGFGTDSGAMPTRIPGYAEHRELELMVAAGLTPLQAIHCATEVNAELLGIAGKTGTLAPGKLADFLILAENPADDIHNTRKLVVVYHRGRRVEPIQLEAHDSKSVTKNIPN